MKKLISTLVAVAVMFAMAIPVMAAGESPEPHGQDNVPDAHTIDGYYVRISDPNPTDYALEVLPDAAANAVGEEIVECSLDAVDVDIVNLQGQVVNQQYFASNTSLLVTFVRTTDSEILAVLYWNDATQSWDSAWFEQDGTVVRALFYHLCTVVFVVRNDEPGSTVSVPTAETMDMIASAQTGYTPVVWAVVAITALVGAVLCFATNKKSAVSAG